MHGLPVPQAVRFAGAVALAWVLHGSLERALPTGDSVPREGREHSDRDAFGRRREFWTAGDVIHALYVPCTRVFNSILTPLSLRPFINPQNQSRKAHRNGIKKPKTNKYPSLKGVSTRDVTVRIPPPITTPA